MGSEEQTTKTVLPPMLRGLVQKFGPGMEKGLQDAVENGLEINRREVCEVCGAVEEDITTATGAVRSIIPHDMEKHGGAARVIDELPKPRRARRDYDDDEDDRYR